jgi:hypothetical protein
MKLTEVQVSKAMLRHEAEQREQTFSPINSNLKAFSMWNLGNFFFSCFHHGSRCLPVVSPAATIVQFVDFSSKNVSKSYHPHGSANGALGRSPRELAAWFGDNGPERIKYKAPAMSEVGLLNENENALADFCNRGRANFQVKQVESALRCKIFGVEEFSSSFEECLEQRRSR